MDSLHASTGEQYIATGTTCDAAEKSSGEPAAEHARKRGFDGCRAMRVPPL